MKYTPLPLSGSFVIDLEMDQDERGFFARTFCRQEFLKRDLQADFKQCSLSYNSLKGTLRGMHFQTAPHEEVKLVSCIQGAIFDVIIDVRPVSKTYGRWAFVELSSKNYKMLYVPKGFAHGFQTLEDHTKVYYQISSDFIPSAARGIRWNDPYFSIDWPYTNGLTISLKDQSYPDFTHEENLSHRR